MSHIRPFVILAPRLGSVLKGQRETIPPHRHVPGARAQRLLDHRAPACTGQRIRGHTIWHPCNHRFKQWENQKNTSPGSKAGKNEIPPRANSKPPPPSLFPGAREGFGSLAPISSPSPPHPASLPGTGLPRHHSLQPAPHRLPSPRLVSDRASAASLQPIPWLGCLSTKFLSHLPHFQLPFYFVRCCFLGGMAVWVCQNMEAKK